ncbi:MAG: hypothetical protein M1840_003512 [Geoglossum simile]|nr:MAG: hypothetical protein M1840_003512 [Geoglossum simile]
MGEEEEYKVEAILDKCQRHGKTQYLVKWVGYLDYETSWENEENLDNAETLLQEFRTKPKVVPQQSCYHPYLEETKALNILSAVFPIAFLCSFNEITLADYDSMAILWLR